ncbi:kinase-like domain-containing protein [Mycena rosella]|uniref:Kinase-like domain-containing protein n=1 Tax=Mycena rosella TaxID=1033263 RepID=A0AAD7DCY1_MYCRO|nr:kinase-like domain-containing protein [Mycena rosella]
MSLLQAPKAPSDQLRRDSSRILPRLSLIIEFRPWLEYTKHTKPTASSFALLWETFALGASLATLLNLLGSPPPRDLHIDADKSDLGLGLPQREKYFTNFIQRVQLLEIQNRIPYGEILRVQDLFGGTNSGFAKVLKTVERVLNALQASYPGLFVLPGDAQQQRQELVRSLLDTEREHVAILRMTGDSAELLSEGPDPINPCLESLIVNRTVLRQYHDRVLQLLEEAVGTPLAEDWEQIFSFEDKARKNAVGAYRAICANYLELADILQRHLNDSEPLLASHAQILLTNVSILLTRTSSYASLLEARSCLFTDSPTYDALCTAVFHLQETSDNLDEMGHLLRTMRSARIFKGRAFTWRADIDPSELGPLFLDDLLAVDASGSGLRYAVFLFEMMLLCCSEGAADRPDDEEPYQYPVRAWDLGPALQQTTPLNLVHAIPTPRLRLLRLSDSDAFELEWLDEENKPRTLEFYTTCAEQYDQWRAALETFVPSVFLGAPSERSSPDADDRGILSEDEDAGGRRRSHARSWSLVARKGPRSESSSLLRQEGVCYASDQESLLSPNLLPRFFGGARKTSARSRSTRRSRAAISARATRQASRARRRRRRIRSLCGDGPGDAAEFDGASTARGKLPTGPRRLRRVWKGVWDRQPDRWVAIKVLRSRLDDPQMEAKMNKVRTALLLMTLRLTAFPAPRARARRLEALDHKHVLKLLGTVSDFGPYDSMVCPWLEQGSVSKYMERRGDILSMTDRLQLLCEVADGLTTCTKTPSSTEILPGSSNILIDDEGKAKLCDFGLSSIVVEFCGTSSLTSCIGGAVRWADASLYSLSTEGEGEGDEASAPVITTRCDIYSFGSVMLEILSGRIPYHYLRTDAQVVIEIHKGNQPRRPATSFVTDAQWALIQRCWDADGDARPDCAEVVRAIQVLHRASLEFRRHTY